MALFQKTMQDDDLSHKEDTGHCQDPNGTVHMEGNDVTMQQDDQCPIHEPTMDTSLAKSTISAAPPPIPSPSPGEYSTTEAADSGRSIPEVDSVGSIPEYVPKHVQVTWNIFYVCFPPPDFVFTNINLPGQV